MRDYGRVSPSFWTGPTGRAIRAKGLNAQVVALYLMTAPSSTMSGLYYLPLPTLAHEVGCPIEGALKALRSLAECGFAFYDEPSETVWVPEMASFQIDRFMKPGDKRIVGIKREVERYNKTPFYSKFYERYKDVFHLGEPSPFEAPSEPHRFQDQDQEQDQDQSTEYAHEETLPLLPALNLGKPANATQRKMVDKFAPVALTVLAALNEARRRVIAGVREIKPSYISLAGICARLDAGKTADECLRVVEVCELEVKSNPAAAKWFDAVSPWRPENFERKLAADGLQRFCQTSTTKTYKNFAAPMPHVAESRDEDI